MDLTNAVGSPHLSVVIPSCNSAPWLPSTLEALELALDRSGWSAEVIVVDDGSTDDTSSVLAEMRPRFRYPLTVLTQKNSGRFLARWSGAQAATGKLLLLLDSRVLIDRDALSYVHGSDGGLSAWNAHINNDPDAPLVGLFWDVPTFLFWGSYLARPRAMTITTENFDTLPKGTTCFLIPTEQFVSACISCWPSGDSRFSSDDTRLLRHVASLAPIRLDPGFSAIYRARATLPRFLRHSFDRGTLFVDSYAGTSLARNAALIALAITPIAAVVALVALIVGHAWPALAVVIAAAIVALVAPAAIAATRRCSGRSIRSYLTLVIPFSGVFWAGLLRGLVIHGGSLAHSRSEHSG